MIHLDTVIANTSEEIIEKTNNYYSNNFELGNSLNNLREGYLYYINSSTVINKLTIEEYDNIITYIIFNENLKNIELLLRKKILIKTILNNKYFLYPIYKYNHLISSFLLDSEYHSELMNNLIKVINHTPIKV